MYSKFEAVRLPQHMADAIGRAAQQQQLTRSEVLRRALADWLAANLPSDSTPDPDFTTQEVSACQH